MVLIDKVLVFSVPLVLVTHLVTPGPLERPGSKTTGQDPLPFSAQKSVWCAPLVASSVFAHPLAHMSLGPAWSWSSVCLTPMS